MMDTLISIFDHSTTLGFALIMVVAICCFSIIIGIIHGTDE